MNSEITVIEQGSQKEKYLYLITEENRQGIGSPQNRGEKDRIQQN